MLTNIEKEKIIASMQSVFSFGLYKSPRFVVKQILSDIENELNAYRQYEQFENSPEVFVLKRVIEIIKKYDR